MKQTEIQRQHAIWVNNLVLRSGSCCWSLASYSSSGEWKWTLVQTRWVLQTGIYRHHVICAKNLVVRSVSCRTTGHRGVEMNSGPNQVSVTNGNIQTSCNMCKESWCSLCFLPYYWSSVSGIELWPTTGECYKQKYTDIMWYVQRILMFALVLAVLLVMVWKWTIVQTRWVSQTEICRHHVICAKNLVVRPGSCCASVHAGSGYEHWCKPGECHKQKYTDVMWYVQRFLFLARFQAPSSFSVIGHRRSGNELWSKRNCSSETMRGRFSLISDYLEIILTTAPRSAWMNGSSTGGPVNVRTGIPSVNICFFTNTGCYQMIM